MAVDRLLADGAPSSAPGGLAAGSTAPLEALYGGRQFTSSTISAIVNEIKTAGNGARGIVQGQKGRRAHVFNVAKVKGEVVFLDGQSGHANLSPWRNFISSEDRLMLNIEDAAVLAQHFLDQQVSHEGMTFALVEGERAQVGTNFYFDCQSAAYLRDGDPRDMAVGTGYVCVDGETKECRLLGAVESAELDLF